MTLKQFWPIYLGKHSKKGTQLMHALGLVAGYVIAILAVISGREWYALAAPMFGYFMAFIGHFWIEGNTPATFGNPLLSFACDHILTWRLIRGEL